MVSNIIIIGVIITFVILKINKLEIFNILSLSMIVSGGIGNLIDRIFRGFVVDYIDINPSIKYPMFNLADILIVIGCIIFAINIIRTNTKQEKINETIYNKKRKWRNKNW